MAEIEPLKALYYDLEKTGGLESVVAPPYDVIDADQRRELEERSPYNVVRIDLPVGDDPYEVAARQLNTWRQEGVVVEDTEPALWPLEQDYTGPDRQKQRAAASSPACGSRTTARAGSGPRAHASRPQGGPPPSHAGDQGQPLSDLLAVLGSRRRAYALAPATTTRRTERPPTRMGGSNIKIHAVATKILL